MALALRRPWRADLLAHREEIDGRPLPADQLRRLRGRRDDRGRRAARHHDGARRQLRRLARPNRDRVRDLPAARLRPPPEDQTDQQGPALPARPRRPRRLPPAQTGDDPPDPLGTHRAELRPDDQVRDGNHGRHRVAPRLPSDARARPREKTIFVARYLRDRDLQREIEEGLNLIESWNRVNGVIFYGKSGEFATNRREQQELGMLSLHILQAALVYVNTLMIQDILAESEWAGVLTPEDLRGLTPLFWAHVLPYGEVKLNMTIGLALTAAQTVETNAESS